MAKYCSSCGTELAENSSYCIRCGAQTTVGENPSTTTYTPTESTRPGKSKVAAGILGILLGSLGIHNFYLGYTGKAMTQLLLTVLSCGILAVISSIWGLVEGIMILTGSIVTDAYGNPLVD